MPRIKRTLLELLYRDFAQTPILETLFRNLAYRFVGGITFCQEDFCTEFVQRFHKAIVPRDLLDILSSGLATRRFQEICAERACIEILYTDLARRFLMEILYREVKRAEV